MKDLKFILSYREVTIDLDHSPSGWDDTLIKYERSTKYWGLIRSFTIPLKFVLEGAELLREAFYNDGIEAEVKLEILKLNRLSLEYYSAYVADLDFSSFNDSDCFVEITVIDGGASKYIKANEGTTYDVPVGSNDWLQIAMPEGFQRRGRHIKELFVSLLDLLTAGRLKDGTFGFRSSFLDSLQTDGILIAPSSSLGTKQGIIDIDPLVSVSFSSLFEALSNIYCLGFNVAVENDKEVFEIEKRERFFTSDLILNVGSVSDVKLQVENNLLFSRVLAGYENQDYDTQPAEWEANCQSVFATDLIRSSKELNLMSDIRADYSGILDMIYTDSEGSNEELFLIECDIDQPRIYIPRLGWIRHNGIQHSHYNTSLTPVRILLNNLDFIHSCLFAPGKGIFFSSGGNQNRLNQTAAVWNQWKVEAYSDHLSAPVWFLPVIVSFELGTLQDLNVLFSKSSTGKIGFSYRGTTLWGYLMDVQVKLADRGKQTFKLLLSADNDLNNLIL